LNQTEKLIKSKQQSSTNPFSVEKRLDSKKWYLLVFEIFEVRRFSWEPCPVFSLCSESYVFPIRFVIFEIKEKLDRVLEKTIWRKVTWSCLKMILIS
jgi:hypothetical protein